MSKSEKERLLAFIQDHKLDMMNDIPGFINAELNSEATGLIIKVAQPLLDAVRLADVDGVIPFELEIQFPEANAVSSKAVVGLGEGKATAVPAQNDDVEDQGVVGVVAMPFKRAISPDEQSGRNQEAFEAWQKRYKKSSE